MINAFNYVIRNRGINTQASYPYRGEQDFCQYRSDTNAVTGMTGYVRVTQGDEIALEDAVRRIGPVSLNNQTERLAFNACSFEKFMNCILTAFCVFFTGLHWKAEYG